jgi:hypothetical protein
VGDFLGDGQQLVFVGGLHRSGTTLLARLLASHDQATGLSGTGVPEDEGQHLQPVWPPAIQLGGPGRFALSKDARLTEESPLATPANAQRVWDAWRPFWNSDSRYLIEKSPPNLVMARFLQQLFPGATFVFIVRHPVTVTLATRKWQRRTSLTKLMENWFTAHEFAQADLPHLHRCLVVSYEWLLADPRATLDEITAFLEMPGSVDISSVNASGSSRYEDEWTHMVATRHRGARRAVSAYRDAAAALGYDLEDLRVAPQRPLVATTGVQLP